MSDNLHVTESSGAYVLGALSPDEAHEVEAHAAACEQCRKEIADLRQVVSVLPLACSSQEPSADLKARILAATKGEDQADAVLRRAVITTRQPKRDFWHRPVPSWAGVAGWLGLAAACVVAGIFIGVVNERDRMMTALERTTALTANEAAAPAVSGVAYKVYSVSADQVQRAVDFIGESEVWDLSVSKTGERIPCKVIQPPKVSHAMLVSDMPPAKNGMVYEVWLIRKGTVHRGGVVMPGHRVQTTIPMRVQSGDVIAFSMEPPGGSAVPSGPFVMEQTL